MPVFRILGAILLILALGVGCGGESGLYESCDTSGSTDDCESGLICTAIDGNNICLKICWDHAQCPASWSCSGVSGSPINSCQP